MTLLPCPTCASGGWTSLLQPLPPSLTAHRCPEGHIWTVVERVARTYLGTQIVSGSGHVGRTPTGEPRVGQGTVHFKIGERGQYACPSCWARNETRPLWTLDATEGRCSEGHRWWLRSDGSPEAYIGADAKAPTGPRIMNPPLAENPEASIRNLMTNTRGRPLPEGDPMAATWPGKAERAPEWETRERPDYTVHPPEDTTAAAVEAVREEVRLATVSVANVMTRLAEDVDRFLTALEGRKP